MTNRTPPPTHNIRKPFDKDLYVELTKEISLAQQWRIDKKRVLTITSPPAQGKSWFLSNFYQLLLTERIPAFFIDITQFLVPGALGSREIDPKAFKRWLIEFASELRKQCPETPKTSDAAAIETNLRTLAHQVGLKCWSDQPIYLFVDGGDEPSKEAFKAIERRLLEQILAAHENWRLIVVLRQTERLFSHELRRSEYHIQLSPFPMTGKNPSDPIPGHKQVEELIKNPPPPYKRLPSLEEVTQILPGYNWIHAGLNYFLFLEACSSLETCEKVCCQDNLLTRAIAALTIPDGADQIASSLISLAQIPTDKWGLEDLKHHLGKSHNEAWIQINELQKLALIVNQSNGYAIVDGLREFVIAVIKLNTV